jgi:hypothetical protein
MPGKRTSTVSGSAISDSSGKGGAPELLHHRHGVAVVFFHVSAPKYSICILANEVPFQCWLIIAFIIGLTSNSEEPLCAWRIFPIQWVRRYYESCPTLEIFERPGGSIGIMNCSCVSLVLEE